MKKCDYCGKEITYMEQYCCDRCQKKAIQFYERIEKFQKVFSIVNAVCVMAIPVGFFLYSMVKDVGFGMVAFAVTMLGITISLLPFPVENMINSLKIRKAEFITRMIGFVLLALGIALDIIFFIFYI